jgi:mRNA-degrading endonuclease RelE of RelBE toxin-antitoxin system
MGTTRVEWTKNAVDDWHRLSPNDAKAVAVAVRQWADSGEGLVIYIEGEFRLLVGAHTVVLLVDGDTVYVDRVRRS